MKMGSEHIVPLSSQALAVLEELRPLTGRCELLFPNRHDLSRPMGENTLLSVLYRMGYRTKATPHGLRAVASSTLNEMGFNADWIERQLAHVERNRIRAAYHRSEYLSERTRMMQAWGDFIESLTTGANVVPIRAG
jgi:integrase